MAISVKHGTIPGTAKGACYLCNMAPTKVRWVDTGKHIKYEGHLFICESCANEIGKAVGMFTEKTRFKYLKDMSDKETTIKNLTKKAESYDFFAQSFKKLSKKKDEEKSQDEAILNSLSS